MSQQVISSLVIHLSTDEAVDVQGCCARIAKVPGLEVVEIIDGQKVAATLEASSVAACAQRAQELEHDPEIDAVQLIYCQTE